MGAGGSGSSSGSPTVMLPPNQGLAASSWGDILSPLAGMSANGGAGTPAAWAYPQAQGLYPQGYNAGAQYLFGAPGQSTLYDQNAGQAVGSAQNAYNNFLPIYGDVTGAAPQLAGGAQGALGLLPQIESSAFSPLYGQMVNAAASNPQYAQALTGASQAAAYGAGGAQNMYDQAGSIMQAGFDPQSALFNRTQQQLTDQSGAANAMAGLGSSPYGAGVASNAMGNFDINWQNNLLNRMEGAAGAASPLYSGATNLAYGSSQLPTQTYMGQIANVLEALKAQNQAGVQGAASYGSLLDAGGQGLGRALGLGTTGAQGLSTLGAAPYLTGATIGNNAMAGTSNLQSQLTGATNLGNNQYLLPQQVLGDLMQYMGLGQQASQLSGNLGQQGFNQTAQGIGGLLSGGNALFGSNGLLGSGGAAGAGGWLPGSGMGAGIFTNPLTGVTSDIAGSGFAGGGGGLLSGLGSMLPMSLSAA
jgi:hypothetical protein